MGACLNAKEKITLSQNSHVLSQFFFFWRSNKKGIFQALLKNGVVARYTKIQWIIGRVGDSPLNPFEVVFFLAFKQGIFKGVYPLEHNTFVRHGQKGYCVIPFALAPWSAYISKRSSVQCTRQTKKAAEQALLLFLAKSRHRPEAKPHFFYDVEKKCTYQTAVCYLTQFHIH